MIYSQPIHIVDARRSAIGRFGGALKLLAAADLALPVAEAVVPAELRERVDEVILGQVIQAGAGMNVARQVGLRLGLPQRVPAWTVNMACASALKAVALGADSIASGAAQSVLTGGVESMSNAPYYATDLRWGKKLGNAPLSDAIFTDGLTDPVLKIGMGETAERLADAGQITREAQDRFALRSQQRATQNAATFAREIVPLKTSDGVIERDEHPRADTTLEKLQKLKPAFRPNGTVTPGNSSGINDGAAMALLASDKACREYHLSSRARIIAACSVGCDPATMGIGPVHAIQQLLKETGWKLGDVDAFEINEAFAAQTLACVHELKIDESKLNIRGGAIALGHPIGCSGARVLVTLLHILEDLKLHRGIASLCVGGGMGIAMAIQRE